MIRSSYFLLVLLCIPIFSYSQKTNKKCFKLPSLLNEVSGLYLQDAQSFWWHNDGGGKSALYKTNGRGRLKDTILLPSIENIDWEDLTSDDAGNIYIGDFGNNLNKRTDLCIYIYNMKEQHVDSILFEYPDQQAFPPPKAQWNFDMEAFFWHNHKLHLFSKNQIGHGNYYCKHYVIPDQAGYQNAVLTDSIYLKNRVVTAAAISPDGQTVALLAYNFKKILGFLPTSSASIFFLTDYETSNFLNGKIHKCRAPSFLLATQFESLDFLDDHTLYVASERTIFIKPKAKRVKIKK